MFIKLLIVFIVTFLVRIVSVITGGAGMILIPLLMSMGFSPASAVATNRLGSLSTKISLFKFHQHRQVKWKLALYFILPTLLGTIIGALWIVNINEDLFKKIFLIIILSCLPLIFLKKKIGIQERKITKNRLIISLILIFFASILGGAFASTGIWFSYIYLFLGLTMLQTVAIRKISGFFITIPSVIIFIFYGLINWAYIPVMLVASGLGGWIGASLGIKVGNKWIKIIFALVVVIVFIKMFFFS